MLKNYNEFIHEKIAAFENKLNEASEEDKKKYDEYVNNVENRYKAWAKVEQCITMLRGNYRFFNELIVQMKIYISGDVKTMATDGYSIFINPMFVMEELSKKEVVFVLAHEIMHCVLLHMSRRGSRDPEKWNKAGDYVINYLLTDMRDDSNVRKSSSVSRQESNLASTTVGSKPASALYDVKYKGMTTEQVYDVIPFSPKAKKNKEEEPEGGEPGQRPVNVGDYIIIKNTGKYGVVKEVRPDGTFKVQELDKTKEEMNDILKKKYSQI